MTCTRTNSSMHPNAVFLSVRLYYYLGTWLCHVQLFIHIVLATCINLIYLPTFSLYFSFFFLHREHREETQFTCMKGVLCAYRKLDTSFIFVYSSPNVTLVKCWYSSYYAFKLYLPKLFAQRWETIFRCHF